MPELEIYGDIGPDWFGQGITGKYVAMWLKAYAKDVPEITVRINSPGGWVSEGIAVHNILASHPARVKVVIDGFALSAASVIAMAGDEIQMMPGSIYMIHPASGGCFGTAEDMEVTASALRKMSTSIADIYAARTGKTKEECIALMEAETWFDTAEALAAGLCDTVIPGKRKAVEIKGSDKKTARAQARWLNSYKNTPSDIRVVWQPLLADDDEPAESPEPEHAQQPVAQPLQPRAARSPNGEHNARPSPRVGGWRAELARGNGRYGV